MSAPIKRIRLEQKAMPVSSEEELNLITLREQNQKLSNNYNHRIRIEADLRKRVEQLEGTLRLCEEQSPEHQLTIVNEELRDRVDELEFELNKVRLNERRLADDLDQLNREFNELRRKVHPQALTNQDSIIRNHHSGGSTGTGTTTGTTTTTSSSVNFHQSSSSASDPSSLNPHNNIAANTQATGGDTNSPSGHHANSSPHTNHTNNLSHHHHQHHHHNDNSLALNQSKAIQELELKLADLTELASNRLKELETLNERYKDALFSIDKLKTEAKCIPKDVIIESAEYKTLQSHFSVLYNEATQLKTQLVESRQLIIEMKNAHARQINRMEHDELRIQKELRTNIVDLEQSLTDARNQLAMFRLEYDIVLKANEQTVKLDTELKKTISSYKIQVQQKNNDLQRLRRLLDESRRADRHQDHNDTSRSSTGVNSHATNNGDNLNNNISHNSNATTTNNTNHVNATTPGSTHHPQTTNTNSSTTTTTANPPINSHTSSSSKRIVELEEKIHQLKRQVAQFRSEEAALMQEIDVTGQAYEEMQEQIYRLTQQLEEREDANLKLMSEHLKTNAFQKHLNEEKAQLEELRESLIKKIEAQETAAKGLNEKVNLLQENLAIMEKELEIRNTLNDSYKQEKLELKQQLAELKSEKDKAKLQLEHLQTSFTDKTAAMTSESFKYKRLIEDFESLKKKHERAIKLQSATTPDVVLMEEIKEYKKQLTCPSCKTKPKDAVLTKCFHVFCFDCLKTRVDTRQRKCPKCNAQFGANDFHRLYLA